VVFIGNIENAVQSKYRSDLNGFVNAVDDLHISTGYRHRFTHQEYLEHLANSRFGLCVRGYGAKCHREVELMGMGTVPLITDDVDISGYFCPPVEGLHYFRVHDKTEILEIVESTTRDQWEEMSAACRTWWEENASPLGAFVTTLKATFL